MVRKINSFLRKIGKVFDLFALLFEKNKNELKLLRSVYNLRKNNPKTTIGLGVKVIGDSSRITLGEGTVVEDGVIFDMQHGGYVEFGARTTIRSGAIITPYGGFVKFGNECGIQHNTILYGHGGLIVGDLVRFAAQCFVIPMNHGIQLNGTPIYFQPVLKKGIKIGSDVWVGGGSLILDGVTIEDGSVIGAGSVVTKSVGVNTIAVGVPANFVRVR